MRADPPRLPARPVATGPSASSAHGGSPLGAADEARGPSILGDASTRRRDDAGGRRSASASRLMGAVTRQLLDDEEERVTGEGRGEGGSSGATATSSTHEGAGKTATRAVGGGGGTRSTQRQPPGGAVRRAGSTSRRASAPEDDVWSQEVQGADEPGRVVGPESRVQPRRGAARIEGVRPDAAPRVGGSPRMRIASWGALLAAVAALVVVIAAGWFDLSPSGDSGNGTGDGGAARQEHGAER
ncbi:hypothetical protein [Mitsuaria sp. GD03876]|uniref:hypothetical protein n=1 Tax=Mitsuaria sp. GD03876 TaxID=2975399 RepID=UPI0024475B99|nr:hypothetical protein [Mitsuaria sp. GD03876]MDH0866045.1 hypothetical protein [Mitsuaria sp. GD03876]